jgi:hypothetical protein
VESKKIVGSITKWSTEEDPEVRPSIDYWQHEVTEGNRCALELINTVDPLLAAM